MWEICLDSKSIRSIQLVGQQVFLLYFVDEPMLLVRAIEGFSGDLAQESSAHAPAILTQRSRSKRKSRR